MLEPGSVKAGDELVYVFGNRFRPDGTPNWV